MRTLFLWMSMGVVSVVAGARHSNFVPLPVAPPSTRAAVLPPFDRVIRMNVEHDETLAALHGDRFEAFVREAIAIHNVEWRRHRREWFELGELTLRQSAPDLDASYVLAKFLHRTTEQSVIT